MILKGKYTNAVIYADIIDTATKNQIQQLIDQEFMKEVKVRIMPDCHTGAGCVIGTTIEIKDKIVPNLVGVDIGCGMLCVKLGKIDIDLESLDMFIHENIPVGMQVNEEIVYDTFLIDDLKCNSRLTNKLYLKKSICSLGGGNHFIEIDRNADNEYYLVIHTGSRNLGKQVAEIYQDIAVRYHENKIINKKELKRNIILEYKKLGKEKEIEKELKKIDEIKCELEIPEELCYLEGNDFLDYMYDMDICQKFASINRYEIAKRILNFLNLDINSLYCFETIHNYINMNDRILRKGAISAYNDEIVLIPINMRDGCIIAKGKANSDYNYSAPHGAGRIMSRNEAFKTISLKDYKESMKNIYSSTVNEFTIDESPFVYKPINSIINNIKDTVEILEIIKPVYSFKADK